MMNIMNYPKEMLDLVNEHDEVVGSIDRDEAYAQCLTNFRVINAFLRNDKGEIFIPRRQMHKRLFPGALDVSCGGHVSSGETYLEAFAKEVREELNLNVLTLPYKILGKLTPKNGVHAYMTVYEIITNETPVYNPIDFSEHYWLQPQAVLDRLETGDTAKSDLPILLKHFYL